MIYICAVLDWIYMWFFRFFIISYVPDTPVKLTLRGECLLLANRLDMDEINKYRPVHAIGLKLRMPYESLREFTSVLRDVSRRVCRDEVILPANLPKHQEKKFTLDHFIAVHNGVYVNPVKEVLDFKTAVIDLCVALEISDDTQMESTVVHYNARALTSVLTGIADVCEQLCILEDRLS